MNAGLCAECGKGRIVLGFCGACGHDYADPLLLPKQGTFLETAAKIARQAVALQDKAIREWSAQCGMTPEEWLRLYQPKITTEPGDNFSIRVVVSAVPNPNCKTLTVSMPAIGPIGVGPSRYDRPPEEGS